MNSFRSLLPCTNFVCNSTSRTFIAVLMKSLWTAEFVLESVKDKAINYRTGQAVRFPVGLGSQISRQSAHESGKVVSPTHWPPLPPRKSAWHSFLLQLSQPQGHSGAGRIMPMKNSNDTIRSRTRHLPACSAVPQPTALRRVPFFKSIIRRIKFWKNTEITSRQHVSKVENSNSQRSICC